MQEEHDALNAETDNGELDDEEVEAQEWSDSEDDDNKNSYDVKDVFNIIDELESF